MKFLIVGVGNIGFRHIEGLSKLSDDNLEFYLYDKNSNFKIRFKNQINDLQKKYKFQSVNKLDSLKGKNFELTVISTTTTDRIKILSNLIKKINTKYVIIEKPISQSEYELNNLKKLKSENIFVNFPRRYCDWHRKIKDKLLGYNKNKIYRAEVSGGNIGLACNACHFIDLINFFTTKKPIKISINQLGDWYKSKRIGFYEVDGTLGIEYEDNIFLQINSVKQKKNLEIRIYNAENDQILFVDYINGLAKFSDGEIIRGKLKYQSESTHRMLKLIQKNDKDLCKLDEAIEPHKLMIKEFINHWNKKFNTDEKKIKIT